MKWPSALDYREAVQNPLYAFKHPVLSASQAVKDHLGFPLVSTGNYACVFKVKSGKDYWAVRCFSNPVTDQKHRYDLLSQHLRKYSSSYLVGFEYLAEGIRVDGQWFPIVMMQWADGESLDSYLKTRVKEAAVMGATAAAWRGLVGSLRGAYMAHGDLQHGNVVVGNNGQMHLVDYDSMFIANMAGEESPEVGHPNYQHPERNKKDFNTGIDNFSALAIYISLRALATEPGLWSFNTGENLILSRKDYLAVTNGTQSAVFKRLEKNSDPEVRMLVSKLQEYCRCQSIDKVPELEAVLLGVAQLPPMPLQPAVQPKSPDTAKTGPVFSAHPQPPLKMKCPQCGKSNEPDEVYCQYCATVLDLHYKICSVCHKEIPVKSQYCTECGAMQVNQS